MSIAEKFEVIADKVYEKGKKDLYNEFWNRITNNNNRTNYRYAFAGISWDDTTFNPPYQLKPVIAERMFAQYSEITKITKAQVDFSQATNLTNAFGYYNNLQEIEEVNLTSATTITQLFRYADELTTIDKLILKDTGTTFDNQAFYGCAKLTNINVIEGLIDGTTISFSSSNLLTEESVLNIFNALKDYSGTTTKPTIQLHSKVKAQSWFDDSIATSKGWDVA